MTDKIEDQELDAAAKAVEDTPVEDVVEEEDETEKEEEGSEEEEKEVEEPEDNAVRSKMGRRISGLEQQLEHLTEELSQAREKKEDDYEEPDGDMPMTRNELRAYLDKEKDDATKTKRQYDNDYIREVMAITEKLEAEDANAILDEMDSSYNSTYSKNGAADAEKNFFRAKIAVLEGKKGKQNPLKGKKPGVATGVTGGTNNSQKEYKMPKLDEHAQDLIASSNFTEDDIKDALENNKLNLSGEHNTKNI